MDGRRRELEEIMAELVEMHNESLRREEHLRHLLARAQELKRQIERSMEKRPHQA